jgi:hypothetical protein
MSASKRDRCPGGFALGSSLLACRIQRRRHLTRRLCSLRSSRTAIKRAFSSGLFRQESNSSARAVLRSSERGRRPCARRSRAIKLVEICSPFCSQAKSMGGLIKPAGTSGSSMLVITVIHRRINRMTLTTGVPNLARKLATWASPAGSAVASAPLIRRERAVSVRKTRPFSPPPFSGFSRTLDHGSFTRGSNAEGLQAAAYCDSTTKSRVAYLADPRLDSTTSCVWLSLGCGSALGLRNLGGSKRCKCASCQP